MSYRGIDFETWKDGGFIVELMGDEIYFDTLKDVENFIDEYLDN